MSPIQHPVLVQILARFVVNLKPQAKSLRFVELPLVHHLQKTLTILSLSPDQLSATIASILHEHIKSPTERTVFWDEQQGKNVDPLANIAGGFWGCDWDLKVRHATFKALERSSSRAQLRILRMLVELQLTHCQNIRDTINKAWNVGINTHKKKEKDTLVQADSSGPSQQNLATAPIATDVARLRYWHFDGESSVRSSRHMFDELFICFGSSNLVFCFSPATSEHVTLDSPRLYVSGNPWKIACDFKCKTKTRQEFMQIIEELKEREKSFSSKKQTKAEEQHILLRQTLESKVEAIDKELLVRQTSFVNEYMTNVSGFYRGYKKFAKRSNRGRFSRLKRSCVRLEHVALLGDRIMCTVVRISVTMSVTANYIRTASH